MALQRKAVERLQRQAREQLYAVLEGGKGLAEGAAALDLRAFNSGGIRQAPVCRHGMAGPHRAGFARGAVADSEDEVHRRRPWHSKFVPRLGAQAFGRRFICRKRSSASGWTSPFG